MNDHHIEEHRNDTLMTGLLFRDGQDRRRNARVPFERPVRVGPAYGAPYATVIAENLSAGGVFIRSDRDAELGAQFSCEVELPTGEKLYIPEVEVLYERGDKTGFGAKFSALTNEVRAILECAAVFPSEVLTPDGGGVSMSMICDAQTALPTLSPRPIDVNSDCKQTEEVETQESDLSLSLPPEPFDELSEPILLGRQEDTDVVRDRTPRETNPTRIIRNMRVRVARRARARPRMWTALLIGGVLGLVAAGLTLRDNNATTGDRIGTIEPPATMGADTHAVLIGAREEPVAMTPVKDDAIVPAPDPKPNPVDSVKLALVAPTTGPKAATVKTAAPAKKPPIPAKTASSPAGSTVALGVSASAEVLRTHVLRNPPRIVIDLIGQDGQVKTPAADANVARVRVGEHPGYTRVVLDMRRVIARADTTKKGGALSVRLDHE